MSSPLPLPSDLPRPSVIVTGFGPFANFPTNPSWLCVKALNKDKINNAHGVTLFRYELPVVYADVDKIVKPLWQSHKEPKLVVHVGVSSFADKLTLETCASNEDYQREDYKGKCPADGRHAYSRSDCCEVLKCGLDVSKICEQHNASNPTMLACVSTNAGRYLCEYTYYASLTMDRTRTLFIHIPSLNEHNTIEKIARGLESIICLCLEQLTKC